jgi:hypothetical protein
MVFIPRFRSRNAQAKLVTDTDHLTTAILAYRKNRINHRLLFGEPVLRIRRGWHRQLAAFQPGQIFAYERWQANQYGTQEWRIAICKTVADGSVTKFPGIHPGIIILLNAIGKTRSKRALEALEVLRVKTERPLTEIPEHHWRSYATAIETGQFFKQESMGK